jgi:hypothetical protein
VTLVHNRVTLAEPVLSVLGAAEGFVATRFMPVSSAPADDE